MTAREGSPVERASFLALAEVSSAITFVYQGEQNIYANPAAESVTGYTREELLALSWWDIIHPDSLSFVRARGEARQRGDAVPARYEVKILTKSGEPRWLDFTGARIDLGGEPAVLGTAFDITEQVLARDALRESEGKYRALLDNVLVGVMSTNLEGEILFANEATQRICGFDSFEELKKDRIQARWADASRRDQMLAQLRRDGRVEQFEIEFIKKNGDLVPLLTSINLHGDVLWGVLVDITERRRMEREAQRGQKLESLGILAGGLAHDFNNFLCTILSNLTLARYHTRPDDDEARAWLREGEQACKRARGLTMQLLTFSKGGEPNVRPVRVADVLRESVGFALRGSNVQCEWQLADDLPLMEVDEGQIAQVIHNIAINAVQAMPRGGSLRVAADLVELFEGESLPPGRYVRLSFVDEGHGISESDLGKIFDPYFTTKRGGTGLGLATTHSIVRRHAGAIRVESARGRGACFRVMLPVSLGKGREARDSSRFPDLRGAGRILVMDDDETIRLVASEILRKLGYEVSLASEGAEAVRLYAEAQEAGRGFLVVILDLTVRGGMGEEAILRLREADPDVCAIVASGYSNAPVLSRFEEFGFRGEIQKPFTMEDLGLAVKACLA